MFHGALAKRLIVFALCSSHAPPPSPLACRKHDGSFNMLAQQMASSKMFPYVAKNQLKKNNRWPRVRVASTAVEDTNIRFQNDTLRCQPSVFERRYSFSVNAASAQLLR